MERNFMDMLKGKWAEEKFTCVGIDIEYSKLSPDFLRKQAALRKGKIDQLKAKVEDVVRKTKDLVCAYKPNIAFYEALGEPGYELLKHTIDFSVYTARDVPIILDAKRGDIGKTNSGYVSAAFGEDGYGADAITVHPYLGSEAMKPFLDMPNKGIIVLCRTSNKGGGEFQDVRVMVHGKTMPFYELVATTVRDSWNYNNNCLLVAGATYPDELARIRAIAPQMPLLIPGIGAQGGDIEKTVAAGLDDAGAGIIINSSSAIIYADDPRVATLQLNHAILMARKATLLRRTKKE